MCQLRQLQALEEQLTSHFRLNTLTSVSVKLGRSTIKVGTITLSNLFIKASLHSLSALT